MKPRVLLDTNIIISGLVYSKGNEHRILKAVEQKKATLVTSAYVLAETQRTLATKFPGLDGLLDAFLSLVSLEVLDGEEIDANIGEAEKAVRDPKDSEILAAVLASKPDFFVTGDATLREDAAAFPGVRAVSSKDLLKEIEAL